MIKFKKLKGVKICDLHLSGLMVAVALIGELPLMIKQGGTVILSGLDFKGEPYRWNYNDVL